jgi:hypothetical protein
MGPKGGTLELVSAQSEFCLLVPFDPPVPHCNSRRDTFDQSERPRAIYYFPSTRGACVQQILKDEQTCFAVTLKNGRRVFFWKHHLAGSDKAANDVGTLAEKAR